MAKKLSKEEVIIELVEEHFIEPNTIMNLADWVKIREKAEEIVKKGR